jgi:hypothetical protein
VLLNGLLPLLTMLICRLGAAPLHATAVQCRFLLKGAGVQVQPHVRCLFGALSIDIWRSAAQTLVTHTGV